MRVGSAMTQPPQLISPNLQQINQSTVSKMSSISDHPITLNKISLQLAESTVEMQRATHAVVGQEGLQFECRTNFCTVHLCKPAERQMIGPVSNYSVWAPSKPPSHSLAVLEFTVPMSCYDSNVRCHGKADTEAQTEKKSILTHSSYWKYKHKIRYMHEMPSIVSTTGSSAPQMTSPVVTKERDLAPKPVNSPIIVSTSERPNTNLVKNESKVPSATTTSSSASLSTSFTVSVTAVSASTSSSTTDIKKLLHRSQSTPGGDHKAMVSHSIAFYS